MNPLEWIEFEIYGNSLLIWSVGIAVFLAVWAVLALIRRLLRRHLQALANESELLPLEISATVLLQTRAWFLMLIALFVGSRIWTIAPSIDTTITRIVMIALLLQAGLWVAAFLLKTIDARREQELEDNPGAVAAIDVMSFVVRVAVWGVVMLMILDNLGINITALVAGLGVGGIAVALAAQNVLGDLFASLSIVLDKPFVVGDFLIIGDFMGAVEKVGIKTTRVRSLSGEQLVFSNQDLLASRIRNYGRMIERRVVFSIGVTYQTKAEQIRRIPDMLREAVEAEDNVRFDRAHFQKYGDFALIFEVVYYVLSRDYNEFMDIQQSINVRIFERFETEGIEFAYPTQTLYLSQAT